MDQAEKDAIDHGFTLLGVTKEDFYTIRQAPTFEAASEALGQVKEKVRKSYRKLALEYHPDHTGNDLEKAKVFDIITKLKKEVDDLKIAPPAPVPMLPMIPMIVIHYEYRGQGRPPPGHPAANGAAKRGPGVDTATTVVTMRPGGVTFHRGK